MKTPSPQEADKWAREKADELAINSHRNVVSCSHLAELIENALLEADKNGYERGREEDEALLRECSAALSEAREMLGVFEDNGGHDGLGGEGYRATIDHMDAAKSKLKARLAPSDSGGEKNS